ncbi:hypothetical protein P3S68_029853 [Capsicum galapagoense]
MGNEDMPVAWRGNPDLNKNNNSFNSPTTFSQHPFNGYQTLHCRLIGHIAHGKTNVVRTIFDIQVTLRKLGSRLLVLKGDPGETGYVGEDVESVLYKLLENILFICGGAFVGLEKTISERRQDSSIGFGAPVRTNMRIGGLTDAVVTSSLLESVESDDLTAYGLIPEFVGRFQVLVSLSSLDEDQLVQVLTEPKNALDILGSSLFLLCSNRR